MNKNLVAVLVVALVLAVVVLSQSLVIIDETEQALVTQFGDFIRSVEEPGLTYKIPFIQQVFKMEKRLLASDADPQEYLTRDKKRVYMDHVARWRITDPHAFYRSVRTEVLAYSRLDDIIFGRLRQEVARHDFIELVGEEREAIMETVTNDTRVRAAAFGIEIVDVRIKRVDLPAEVQESVFARMEAERNRVSSRYRAEGEELALEIRASANRDREIILAEARRLSQILRGEGDAEATTIYASAFEQDPEFYSFVRSLEAYEKFLTNDTTMLLGIESELFRYLQSSSGR